MRRWIPLTVLALLLGLMVLLHWAAPSGKLLRHPVTYLGALPVLIGAIIGALGLHQLLKARTTVKAFHQPDRLVSDGVFRYTRNPIYLGAVLILSGVCILMGVHCLLIPAAVFVIIAGRWFVRAEEEMLARKFGKAWEEYRARTPRWISVRIITSLGVGNPLGERTMKRVLVVVALGGLAALGVFVIGPNWACCHMGGGASCHMGAASPSDTPGAGAAVVNTKCPIMGNSINPAKVSASLLRDYKDQKVGFCCGMCPGQWDKLTDAQKDAKLKATST